MFDDVLCPAQSAGGGLTDRKMALAFAGPMEQMVKTYHLMDVHSGNAQILGNIFFRLRCDQPLFFLNKMQHR